MKARVHDDFPLRLLGLYALALVVMFIIFSLIASYTRSQSQSKFAIPDEKAAAEQLLAEKLTGPRYFQLEAPSPETPHPYLSPFQAKAQVARIVSERQWSEDITDRVNLLIDSLAEPPPSRAIGTDRVNVYRLNLALDELP